jgi:nicotinamidase-related amidase
VVDFQNYFLSPALGRPAPSPSLEAVEKLVKTAIPACRTANIPVVWLGWGLEDKDLDDLPPTIVRGFGLDTNFEGEPKSFGGLGEEIGQVELPDGTTVDGGRVLMRDQWNTKFQPSLEAASVHHDMQISKNPLSGFWGGTDIEDTLKSRGIKTLLFAGGNLDQCVASSMQDAYQKGWDVLLLSDASVTNSPEFATKMVYFKCEGGWGFVLTCDQLAEGVGKMETSVNAE